MAAGRVLLVAPPWRLPYASSLALGTLGPIARAAGFEVDELHGAPLMPEPASGLDFLETYAKFLFVRAMNETPADVLFASLFEMMRRNATIRGTRYRVETWEGIGIDGKTLERQFHHDLACAETCLDRMAERALAKDYDVIGFSATFDSHVPASLALARRIKAARPETKIVLGGAACFEEQGEGLARSFPILDAVCHTEGEAVILPLLGALADGGDLAAVPGIAWRRGGEVVVNASPPLLRDLDALPIPDYRAFVEAFHGSEWTAGYKPMLLFETSRGCWWGQKKLCTFCGLNAEGLAFRAKSPERAYDEIVHLYRAYPTAFYLQATDNILEMKYLTTVFPRLQGLAAAERPLRMFYEVKSNMRPDQVRAMRQAGVDCVQPGIESFSDEILELMNKGCTALGQIQFIKWAYQERIDAKYNVIVASPGEQAAWYAAMLELLPFLEHLPPPVSIVNMQLERFSPYFQDPARYGIRDVRPQAFYQELYPAAGVDLPSIAYQFDFDHPDHDDPALNAAIRRFVEAAQRWKQCWQPGQAYYVDDESDPDAVAIVDRRPIATQRSAGGGPAIDRLSGPRARLLRFLDQHRSRAQIDELLGAEPVFVDAVLAAWLHRRWICRVGDRYLCVLPRDPSAAGGAARPAEPEAPEAARKHRSLPMVA